MTLHLMGLTRQSTSRMPKRKASSFKRSVKRFKGAVRKRKFLKGKRHGKVAVRSAAAYARTALGPRVGRQLPFYRQEPPRCRTTHVNNLTVTRGSGSGFISGFSIFRFGNLRDPEDALADQAFPENYLRMAAIYRFYRVNSVELTVECRGLSANTNHQFVLCMDSSSSFAPPDDYSGVTTAATRNAFMQNPTIRKRFILGDGKGGEKRSDPFWNIGSVSIAKMENVARHEMSDFHYAKRVNADGTHVGGIGRSPLTRFFLVSRESGGFPSNLNVILNIKAKFHVEWFDSRQVVETTNVVLTNDPVQALQPLEDPNP